MDMNKPIDILEVMKLIDKSSDIQEKQSEILKTMADTDDRLIEVIAFIQKVISVLIFIIAFLVVQVLFGDLINDLINSTSSHWGRLSEGYRLLIFTLIGSIPAGIITAVISHIIISKIKTAHKPEK